MIKVELHCHLDGGLPKHTFLKLSKQLGLVDCDDKTWVESHFITKNMPLVECLKCFDLLTSLLQSKENLIVAVRELIDQKYNEGVRLLEIRFAPQLHDHLTMQEATEAVLEGRRLGLIDHPDMVVGIIAAMMNNDRMDLNEQTIDIAYKYKDQGIVGIDLAGNEGFNPLGAFDELLEKAHNLGLNITLHAGESMDYHYVQYAMDHYATRIGHGIHASQNPQTVQNIIDNKVLLEISPQSNLMSNCVDLEHHPIRDFFDKGVLLSISTDDPLLLNLTIDDEYKFLKENFNFTDRELMLTNLYGAKASFCKDKDRIIKQIEEEIFLLDNK